MNVSVDLLVDSPAWSAVPDLSALTERAVSAALEEAGASLPAECEVSCLFCDDAGIRALNARWRGIDKPTNVLSFPAGTGRSAPPCLPGAVLGDIVLAFETVEREASRESKRLHDHVSHLVVHGTLHLLGYDHENDAEAARMEQLESRAMIRLGAPDPYAEPEQGNAP